MRTIFATLLSVLALTVSATTQGIKEQFTVKGTVLDSATMEGEPYATIRIAMKSAPSEAVRMTVTDAGGKFRTTVPGSGSFVLTVSSAGRKGIVRSFGSPGAGKTADLGNLLITDAGNLLKGVEIVSQKPLVKADIDKIEYSMEDDPDSKSSSVLEMLRKVPTVTVDGEDNIKVNGSSSFKIYVNGKPNNMMSNNPAEVLKSLPANTIKRIEVITNPGPKYDAEGVGGILNIITAGSGLEGYTATFSGNASTQGAGGGLFGTVKRGRLTVSGRYNYNYSDRPRSYSGSSRTTTGQYDSSSSNIVSNSTGKSRSSFQSGSLEASYEIDTLRLLTASFGLWGGNSKSDGTTVTGATSPADGSALYGYSAASRSENSWYSIDGSIDYQRMFSVKDRMLTLSYRINTQPDNSDSYSDYNDKHAATDWEDFMRRMTDQRNDGSQNSTENTFQADYSTPIGKMHTIEAGAKYIIRINTSENDRYEKPADGGDYAFDTGHSSHYRHRNDILAAYAGYGLKWKKLSARLGLRYEHTAEDVEFRLGRGDDFSKDFNDIVPSASIGYKLTDLQNIRIGYNMRIYRPGIWYLNPYLDDSTPTDISQGNPNLDSEKSHSFSMSYSNFTSKLSLNMSLRYSFTDNSIERVTSMLKDTEIEGLQNPTGKEVMYNTYRNMGHSRSLTMSGYANWNATKHTRIYMNLYGGHTYLSDGKGLSNDGWNISAYGGIQQTLPHDWRVSLSMFGQTPWMSLQGRGSSFFDYSININKSFMDKRFTVSAYASCFLKKYTTSESTTEDAGFTQESWSRYTRQRFGISLSYRIGELKATVRKAARTISNDDVKNSGGNGK